MKKILDTVHGYIMVPDEFIKYIVDTVYFQRLRRIEQTSIRAVYPSARHDRFIHSLGVFHIGSLIFEHLKKEAESYDYWGETATTLTVIGNSYLAACLLHDIAHAPFSHTFEKYFGTKNELAKLLADEVDDNTFSSDLDNTRKNDDPNFHEYMSAYVAYHEYFNGLRRMSLDPELVVRMITGIYYEKNKRTHQLQNCFISLLHGKVIDADRLDYACRDVWASGYSTSSIDVRRLISGIHIEYNPYNEGYYAVCFESSCLNEIDGVLNVKDFQVKYVINHHTVNYEQWLLVHAAEHMAKQFFPREENEYRALGKIINKDAIIGEIKIPTTNYLVTNLSDDDLIFLMKQDKDNQYYQEWSSRQYTHVPLWKSPDEFYHFYRGVERRKSLKNNKFEEAIKTALKIEFKIEPDTVIISPATFKPRVKKDNLFLTISRQVVRYTEIYPEAVDDNEDIVFYYVFIPKIENESERELEIRKTRIKESLKIIISGLYPQKNK